MVFFCFSDLVGAEEANGIKVSEAQPTMASSPSMSAEFGMHLLVNEKCVFYRHNLITMSRYMVLWDLKLNTIEKKCVMYENFTNLNGTWPSLK